MTTHTDFATDWMRLVAIAAALVALIWIAALAAGLFRMRRQIAWRAALRRNGWLPPALSAAAIVILTIMTANTRLPPSVKPMLATDAVVEAVIPLAIAVQAALALSPDDEPALEVIAAAPRAVSWVALERYVVAFASQSLVAVAGAGFGLLVAPDAVTVSVLWRWLPAAILLSGVSLFVTQRSRQSAMGIVIVILIWFVTLVGRDAIVPTAMGGVPFPAPFDRLQPALWILHPYFGLNHSTPADYELNRIVVCGVGCGLAALAMWHLRDVERLLLGVRALKTSERHT